MIQVFFFCIKTLAQTNTVFTVISALPIISVCRLGMIILEKTEKFITELSQLLSAPLKTKLLYNRPSLLSAPL